MICDVVFIANDLAHYVIVYANLLLIVMHCCGTVAEFVCTKQCCVVCPFRGCVFGGD